MSRLQRQAEVLARWSKDAPDRKDRKITASAPAGAQGELYRKFVRLAIKGKKDPWVLILGMTPELRNIAMEEGATVVAVDINQDVICSVDPNIKDRLNTKNIMARGDWLMMDQYLQNKKFDVVMGDGVTGQLLNQDTKKLVKVSAHLLKKGGYFISRVDIHQPALDGLSFAQALELWRAGKMNIAEFSIVVLLYSEYKKQCYNPRTGLMKTYLFWDIIEKLYRKGVVTKAENEAIQKTRISLTHYNVGQKTFLAWTGKYFKPVPFKPVSIFWSTYVGQKK